MLVELIIYRRTNLQIIYKMVFYVQVCPTLVVISNHGRRTQSKEHHITIPYK